MKRKEKEFYYDIVLGRHYFDRTPRLTILLLLELFFLSAVLFHIIILKRVLRI